MTAGPKASSPPTEPVIGYLTGTYPRASDTFIRIEVRKLRELGADVRTFAVRRPSQSMILDAEIRAEVHHTQYLLTRDILRSARDLLWCSLRRPWGTARAAWLSWKAGQPGLKGRLKGLAYLAEGMMLAARMHQAGVTHLHNHLADSSATVAMLASCISGIPFSQTVHGPYIFFQPQHWALGEKIRRSAFTACISHFCLSQCMLFAPPEAWSKLRLVRCAVYEGFLERPVEAIPRDAGIVFVGRLAVEKGVMVLLDAAEDVARRVGAFKLVMIGDGPARSALEREIRARGLESHVSLRGWQDAEAIQRALWEARALVLPSFAEGLPVVLMEALAMGRPVIATRVGAVAELVTEGENGWLVPPASVAPLRDAMCEALTAPVDRLGLMGLRGRKRVETSHHPAIEVGKLLAAIRATAGFEEKPGAPAAPGSAVESNGTWTGEEADRVSRRERVTCSK